ncbi:RusA family crossover junction endodeoxyribonuclease [Streptococcus gallolyticus subsp. gallolyticus]|uniref:RusA family crossover junction endodeoxyribonuclease n=1 Tax=Streptococcus gallolyticus TaxID=315405 RepID=UPI00228366A8|nr:RusA family crossover junction endodeoxyribonuclease [Streptococcus gallolyticus]MCY7152140.1 RusA family crossover junction endodeoxyribonuclease [Streptococcus gallolyticus subsp. gallolyticus]MCY7174952.1 RusA family crossover junction endodeoxyribonuclease [Streptococcus gallolyticus subsp. gallolyticus]MCY7175175.1 RusA family crossover junction endodeoxyribonuclease [Streptococcus gallolyticus subsp. gallolyticus]MCY7181180.1 RusA family crossover junction endodeoxyribonuclease [Strept
MIEFFLPMKKIPTVTHQQKKVRVIRGKPQFYEPDELKETRTMFMELLAPYAPEEPMDGPLRLTTKWLFPKIKGTTNGQYKHTKPDTENLLKLPKDCMQELGFFVNDSRVASEITEKFWADTVGIYVRLENL